jgi:hypothetical protein
MRPPAGEGQESTPDPASALGEANGGEPTERTSRCSRFSRSGRMDLSLRRGEPIGRWDRLRDAMACSSWVSRQGALREIGQRINARSSRWFRKRHRLGYESRPRGNASGGIPQGIPGREPAGINRRRRERCSRPRFVADPLRMARRISSQPSRGPGRGDTGRRMGPSGRGRSFENVLSYFFLMI